ncbi:MAG TPA: TAT-variant-translocated molybdopterin oxidoreductase, partial [Candidatus Acidoferrales bacterium]
MQPPAKPERKPMKDATGDMPGHLTSMISGAASAAASPRESPSRNPPRFWRSLDERAGTPAFAEHAENEFPHGPNDGGGKFDRREILKVMAASAALAGLTGCTKLPTQKILPYVRQPEEIIPGKPLFYATAMPLGGVATGILVESHMARPTKIEGNPDHPASQGGSDAFAQAAVLSLYDPDRSQAVIHDARIASWSEFQREAAIALEEQRAKR